MRATYRHPVAAIIPMALTLAMIAIILSRVGALVPLGGAIVLMFAIASAVGVMVWAILFALRRSGVHRLSEVRTWTRH